MARHGELEAGARVGQIPGMQILSWKNPDATMDAPAVTGNAIMRLLVRSSVPHEHHANVYFPKKVQPAGGPLISE